MRTLVLGGIRSGKSHWAEQAIESAAGPDGAVSYLATSPRPSDADDDWAARIAAHCQRRPRHWITVESSDIATQLRDHPDAATLADDIGNWLTETLDRRDAWESGQGLAQARVQADIDDLIDAVTNFTAPLVLVSPEVGLTVVPATASGRLFADALGTVNQRLAAVCDQVVLVVAGLPLTLKSAEACR